MPIAANNVVAALDSRQVVRIEAVHRGFLYQHLYAAACLFGAAKSGATKVVVEHDEDIELIGVDRQVYLQVKTRRASLVFGDIDDALDRFAAIRKEHAAGRRKGRPFFAIIANVSPGPQLKERLAEPGWPADVAVLWPGGPLATGKGLPAPQVDVNSMFAACCDLARSLPFAMLAPETLVWKLAGRVMHAAAGLAPHADHTFETAEMPGIFEQLVIQLQDFPAPPLRYRPQDSEPPLISSARVRLITGFSGAGKTSWVSQTALHATDALAYFNASEVPSTALVSTVARELAARLFSRSGGKLGEILFPDATSPQILFAIGKNLTDIDVRATVVVDNVHRVSHEDVRSLIDLAPHLHFVLLAQPGPAVGVLQAILNVVPESLGGWTNETIAAEGSFLGCRGDYSAYQRLQVLTAGLPLYVQNALQISANHCGGDVARFCGELEGRTHAVETAQELILSRVFEQFGDSDRRAIGALSLFDVPVSRSEAVAVLSDAYSFSERNTATLLRKLQVAGAAQVFGVDHFKVHDAMRLLGNSYLDDLGPDEGRRAQLAIKNLLVDQLPKKKSMQRVSLLLRMFVALGDTEPLIEMATDELFHELGYMTEVANYLENLAGSPETKAIDRFWALDGLAFADFKKGDLTLLGRRLALMEELIEANNLGSRERLSLAMKRVNNYARNGDSKRAHEAMEHVINAVPDEPDYLRIAKYNFARALFSLKDYSDCSNITSALIPEYFDLLGLTPEMVIGTNPDKLMPLLKDGESQADDLKHLADTLDLHAMALNRMGTFSGLSRIHAMKFYSMANALDSFVRVGQDLADEFLSRFDYDGALDVFERNLLPAIRSKNLMGHVIPVRSHYAVALAYAGKFAAADAEMARLMPYEQGLSPQGRNELQAQREIVAGLKLKAPPPQWQFPRPTGK
ncbi:ATP-binding protein [Bradyrhizobium ivorense]|uniref:ATP-binding protein n=1 Tax=Bradyrhizobium ivorense TaxID=2511166 RepID=UPI001E3B5D6B|nr:ATP-binding protein [Bradyrhizobium ivorense]